jgi:hypothetical protein
MGHAFAPDTFPSKRQALEHAHWMINNDYAWTYRIIKEKKRMREIFDKTLYNIILGVGFTIIACVILACGDFNGFIYMMFVAFFNFLIVIYEAIGEVYDKLREIEKKLDAEK